MPLSETIVKLQRFWCVRYADGRDTEVEAEKALKAAGEKHHGKRWPDVARFYTVAHFKQGHRRASALISAYEHVGIYGEPS